MPSSRTHLASLVADFERAGNDLAIVARRGLRVQQFTYRELALLARRFAGELELRGIGKGERVVIWGENGGEWVASFFGCVLRGVLPVPIDAASPPGFLNRVVDEVSPRLLLTDASKSNLIPNQAPHLALDHLAKTITSQFGEEAPGLSETDPLQIVFTSGTTAEPKGIVHTHRNVLASLRPIETEMERYRKYERIFHPIRVLHTLPLSHVFGQFMGLWTPPLVGIEVHYETRIVAAELIAYIHKRRISVLAAVPRVLDLLEQHLLDATPDLAARVASAATLKPWQKWWRFRDIHRLFGLKFWALVCGGAALSSRSEQFWNALGFVVIQGYGMTETTALVSLNHPFKLARGTVGQILPGREVRLGEDGEVLVRGDTISRTIWQGGEMRPADSEWLATGDLAELDAAGNLRFRGRKKEVIVTPAGLNIYPEDLEAALLRQPEVKAAAIIERIPEAADSTAAEPLAVLILKPHSASADAVVANANQELAEFQQIRRWIVWPEPDFPRTSTGKVLRREIARQLAEGMAGALASIPHNGELNLDSLGRVELQAQLESKFGVTLDESAVQDVKTAADIQALLDRSATLRQDRDHNDRDHRYPYWPWNPIVHTMRALFLELIGMPLERFLAAPRVRRSKAQLPDTPMLLVANHVTSYDAAFVLYALPRRIRRRVAIAMSGEMILDWRRARNQGHWFLNWIAPLEYFVVTALFNVFPLPQLSGFRRSFRHAGEAVDRGYSVLIFPEGLRSDDGTPLPFKPGSGLLWKELGIPALPFRLEGLGELKVQGRGWFRSGKICVSVGELLQLEPAETPEALAERLRQGIFNQHC